MAETPNRIQTRLDGSIEAIRSLREQADAIGAIVAAMRQVFSGGGTVYTAGNGGSAAEALHLAEELIGRYRSNRPPFRAVSLAADPTALTCIANDFGFEAVFARQVEALVTARDLLVVFSTSGNSENLVRALRIAADRGATTVGLLGGDGGTCRALCAHAITIPSTDSAHIQEAHQVVLHLLCEHFEDA